MEHRSFLPLVLPHGTIRWHQLPNMPAASTSEHAGELFTILVEYRRVKLQTLPTRNSHVNSMAPLSTFSRRTLTGSALVCQVSVRSLLHIGFSRHGCGSGGHRQSSNAGMRRTEAQGKISCHRHQSSEERLKEAAVE